MTLSLEFKDSQNSLQLKEDINGRRKKRIDKEQCLWTDSYRSHMIGTLDYHLSLKAQFI